MLYSTLLSSFTYLYINCLVKSIHLIQQLQQDSLNLLQENVLVFGVVISCQNTSRVKQLPKLQRIHEALLGFMRLYEFWMQIGVLCKPALKVAHREIHTSLSAPVWASNLLVAMASISSMKMIDGEFSLASRKTSRTMRGPSPRYFCTNSEPTTRINEAARH